MSERPFRDAEIGDAVRIKRGGWDGSVDRSAVVRKTGSFIETADGSKWTLKGRPWGSAGGFSTGYAELIKSEADFAEELAEQRLRRARSRIADEVANAAKSLTMEQIVAIRAAIAPPNPSPSAPPSTAA